MVKIVSVAPRSKADRAGIRPDDILISLNGKEINDVLDYRFYLAEKKLRVSVMRDGKKLELDIKKSEYDDIGLDFETPLMDKKHSCENKCIFCFIDQLPRGLRDTLYFKDDDSRLSFLHGNYITLTNLHDRDIERIIEMRISPVNVSVHTTNPELRKAMMHNKRAGEVLKYLKQLADADIKLCCQIVLCKGVNDKEELARTMRDLAELYPALQSTSVVPAGLTKYRDGLYELSQYTPEECGEIIEEVTSFGDECLKRYGTRLFYPADELYIKSGTPIPEDGFYEEYSQIENGVGMIRELREGFRCELDFIDEYLENFKGDRTVSVATGYAAYESISALCEKLCRAVDGLKVNVYPIRNDFFGEDITVAGLLVGEDMAAQLSGRELGESLLIPSVTLRAEGDLFLDGKTPEWLSETLGVEVIATDSDAGALISAILGI